MLATEPAFPLPPSPCLDFYVPYLSAWIKNGSEPTPVGSTFSRGSTLSMAPPFPAPRTLVLCFDGTGDQFDADARRNTSGSTSLADERTATRRTRILCSFAPP